MRMIVVLFTLAVLVTAALTLVDTQAIAAWAAAQQRGFQNQMADAVHGLRSGAPGAWSLLLGAAGAYGFVHAVGPGHGKALIGGVGVASSVSMWRLLSLSLISSLAQALWAIVLVYGGFALLDLSARHMTSLAESVLAPASYLAIAAIGLVLIWRGVRPLLRQRAPAPAPALANAHHHTHEHDHSHHHDHDHHHHHHDGHGDCGCHAHGPSPEEVAGLTSLREAAVLVASIAVRPCTGAIFLLVIAWQMDIRAAGAVAVIVMGLGTASLTSLVAVSTVAARGAAFASFDKTGVTASLMSALQVVVGALIIWISLIMLGIIGGSPFQ